MRGITKGLEPASLTAHRKTVHCDYDNYADKAGLRNALIAEQGGLCCYCTARIHGDPTEMKIEHWQCQDRHSSEQLNYRNLLGACPGGKGQPPQLQHCDTRKGDRDLKWNPADPAHHVETRLSYELDGSIRSGDVEFDQQLVTVLNLNIAILKNNRKGILDSLLHWWRHEKARLKGPVPRERLQQERDRRIAGTGELSPYCQVAVRWLEQRLSRMSR